MSAADLGDPRVVLVDYGIGNLLSVERALESAGARVLRTADPSDVRRCERLVIPGVGAFGDCMAGLGERGLTEAVREVAVSGRPWLGICVGMQMLLATGEEFGDHPGLGVIPGRVREIEPLTTRGERLKVPHIGWNGLTTPADGQGWAGTLLEDTGEGSQFYFVHSFAAEPVEPSIHLLAETRYGGRSLCAVVRSGAAYGVQFHPEKSGLAGLRMLRTFLTLPGAPKRLSK
jgi:glutamine amidotransferase